MSLLGKIAASVAGPLVSGLFGSKKPKAQGVDYLKLRRDAEAAGFNPLTALLAGGGAGYQREFNPALSSGSFVAEAISRGADTYFSHVAARDAEAEAIRDREHQKELVQMQIDQRAAGRSFGFALTDQRPYSAATERKLPPLVEGIPGTGPNRPSVHPFSRETEMVPLRDVHGKPTQLPRSVVERLDLKAFDQLLVEDYEALYGDEGGQVMAATKIPKTVVYHSTGRPAGPVFGADHYGNARDYRKRPDRKRPAYNPPPRGSMTPFTTPLPMGR